MWRIVMLHRPEWPILIVGVIAAACSAGTMPAYAFIFSFMLSSFYVCDPVQVAYVINGTTHAVTVYGRECVDLDFAVDNAERCLKHDVCFQYLQVLALAYAGFDVRT